MGKSQQWQMVKLGEVCELKRGQSITRKQIQEGKIPVIAGGLSPAYYHNQANRNGETIAVAGSGKNAGFVSCWNEPVFLSDSFSVIPNSKALNSKFVFYFLKNRQDYIYTLQIATGVPHIYPSTLQNFQIPLPPLETQENIAHILSVLDSKIELNNRINKALEKLSKLLYTRYFVEFNFPNAEGKPYKQSGGEMIYNPTLKQEIPKGWEALKLEERLNFIAGAEFGASSYAQGALSKNHIPFYRVQDMLNPQNSVYIDVSKENAPLINEDDLLVSFDGSVGRVAYGLNGTYCSGIRKITDKHNLLSQAVLFCIFTSTPIQYSITQHATGSNIKHAGDCIAYLAIPFSQEVFLDFGQQVDSIFELMKHTKLESQKLSALRDYLLPLLFNNQVEVC